VDGRGTTAVFYRFGGMRRLGQNRTNGIRHYMPRPTAVFHSHPTLLVDSRMAAERIPLFRRSVPTITISIFL